LLVLITHSYEITGFLDFEPLYNRSGISFGFLAVDVFFVVSGFLVTGSLVNRGNLMAFFWARILRIYPALVVAVLFCVFIIGFHYTTYSSINYLSSQEIYIFILKNATLLSPTPEYYLPGTFENNPHQGIINGSLWTLPWETRMYLLLGLVALLFKPKLTPIIISIAVVSVFLYLTNHLFSFAGSSFQSLIRFISLFFMGAGFFLLKDKVIISYSRLAILFIISTALIVILITLFIFESKTLFFIFYSLTIGYYVLYIAYSPTKWLRKFNQFGDYSYGLYIYAFPIQQSIVAQVPGIGVMSMFIISFSLTLLCAIISWHLIEKPSLKVKKNFLHFKKKGAL